MPASKPSVVSNDDAAVAAAVVVAGDDVVVENAIAEYSVSAHDDDVLAVFVAGNGVAVFVVKKVIPVEIGVAAAIVFVNTTVAA